MSYPDRLTGKAGMSKPLCCPASMSSPRCSLYPSLPCPCPWGWPVQAASPGLTCPLSSSWVQPVASVSRRPGGQRRETPCLHAHTHPPHVLLPFLSALLQWLDSSPDTSPVEHCCPGPGAHRAAGTPLPSHTPLDLGMVRDDDGFLLD